MPTDDGTAGYVYLFAGGPGADSSAGVDHVAYDFVLDAGTYKDDYLRRDGPNPESSTVTGLASPSPPVEGRTPRSPRRYRDGL